MQLFDILFLRKKRMNLNKTARQINVISYALCIFFAACLGNATSPYRHPQSPSAELQSSDLKLTYGSSGIPSHPCIKNRLIQLVGLVEINWEDFRANGATYKLTATSQAIYGCRNFHFITRFVSKNVCQLATEILIIKLKIQLRNTGFIALLS